MKRLLRTAFLLMVASALLVLSSCLPVPLGDPEHSQVDPKLGGFWVDSDSADSGNMYVIAALDAHQYIVQAVQYTRKDDEYITRSSAWRAWLTDVKGTRFITLQAAANMADPGYPAEKYYPTAKLTLSPDKLVFKGIDANYSKFKNLKDSHKLLEIIQENLTDSEMYVEFETPLRRMDARNEADAALMKLAIPSEPEHP